MHQQIAMVTLGVRDLARARRFYVEGFRWKPVFETDAIIFYQMNGLVFGTWLDTALADDTGRAPPSGPGAFALAHNVLKPEDVQPMMDRLCRLGGSLLKPPTEPPHGGLRGYVADPDGHAWEIAWNPAWPIDPQGHVSFGS